MTSPAITGVHPYAEKFPMLPDEELEELAESIRANGLRNPIVVTPDGLILDGRNRFAACTLAGVTPDTIVYEGDDLADYVVDANVARRNQSTGAKAMSKALVMQADGRRKNGRWVGWSKTADASCEEPRNLTAGERKQREQAGIVLDHAPDLAWAVVTEQLALNAAFGQAEERRDVERHKAEEQQRLAAEEADARTFIEEAAPDLAARVDGADLLSFVEARDLWNRRNREEAARIRREEQEAARKAEDERKAFSDLYTGMATALSVIGGYGGYADIRKLMNNYDPAELHPPMMVRYFSATNLADALHFVTELIDWEKETQQ